MGNYIGRGVDIGMFEKQVLTADSSTTTFTLTYAVGSANSLLVVYGGVCQEPQVAYSVSGGGQSIVFSEAPATGTTTYIIYLGKQLTTPRAAGQETTKQTFAGDGSTVTFTLTDPPVVPAGIMVFVDGILQREGTGNNYVSSGSTITFTSAPDSSAEIDVYTLVKEKVSIDTVADGSITVTKLAAGHPTWNGAGETVIATASSGNSLRITNTGSGNSLLVEDSASTDSTPFVITAAGDVGIGTSSPAVKLDVAGNATVQNGVLTVGKDTIYDAFINTPESMYFNVDSDANSTGNRFVWGTDRTGNAGGTEWMRIDSSGNLMVGTTSSTYGGLITSNGNIIATGNRIIGINGTGLAAGTFAFRNSVGVQKSAIGSYYNIADEGNIEFLNGTTTNAVLTSSGNLGIGITSPATRLNVSSTGNGYRALFDDTTNDNTLGVYSDSTNIRLVSLNNARGSYKQLGFQSNVIVFSANNGSESARIDTSGNLLVGTTSADQANTRMQVNGGNTGTQMFVFKNTQGSGSAYVIQAVLSYSPNDATSRFITCGDSTTDRILLRSNGGIANYSANNVNLSDRREKTNFAPAGNYLDKICAIPVQTFNYIDQNNEEDPGLTLGVVAQDVQEVAPELVMESDWGTKEETKMRLSIYQTDLQYALMKSIQELKAIVDAQAVEIAALKAK